MSNFFYRTKDILEFLVDMDYPQAARLWADEFQSDTVVRAEAKNWFQAQQVLGTIEQRSFRLMEAYCICFAEYNELETIN
jgi:hypothetical protein